VDWIHLAQDREQWQGCCEHVNELSGSVEGRHFLTSRVTVSFSRTLHGVS
jgi:hypothetical protein